MGAILHKEELCGAVFPHARHIESFSDVSCAIDANSIRQVAEELISRHCVEKQELTDMEVNTLMSWMYLLKTTQSQLFRSFFKSVLP